MLYVFYNVFRSAPYPADRRTDSQLKASGLSLLASQFVWENEHRFHNAAIKIYLGTPAHCLYTSPSSMSLNITAACMHACTLHAECCVRYCTYWSSRTQIFIYTEKYWNQVLEKTLARGQGRTHKHRLQGRLPPPRSHLAMGSLPKWGDASSRSNFRTHCHREGKLFGT